MFTDQLSFLIKKVFLKNHGFDSKIFLYWEETDFTKRALKKCYHAYQLNKVKVIHEKGKAVYVKNNQEEQKLIHLYSWHFIWSKFYFFQKTLWKNFCINIFYTYTIKNIISNYIL